MEKYFAAANTKNGFVSRFDHIFDPRRFDRVYIIKGGSGTGKSTFMKKAAARAEAALAKCKYYYCSSDPDSLDGLTVRFKDGKRIAILDGTAPHITDPRYPACIESTVNLAEYLCEDILALERKNIISLTEEKSRYYREGYRLLSYAGLIGEAVLRDTESFLLRGKLEAAMYRLLARRMRETGVKSAPVREDTVFLSGITSKGEVYFDSFADSELVFNLNDTKNAGPFLFESLISAALKLGVSYERAPSPLDPNLTEGMRFAALSMSVLTRTDRNDAHPINLSRFIDSTLESKADRSRRRMLLKASAELKEMAAERFAKGGSAHAELEKIYKGAMDFTRLDEASERYYTRMGL